MKKLFVMLLFCLLICAYAMAEEAGYVCGDYTYIINKDGTAMITALDPNIAGDIILPEELDGHTVTAIGDGALRYCCSLTRITIPDTIISVGAYPFPRYVELIVSPEHPTLEVVKGVLFDKTTKTLLFYPNTESTSYVIPEGTEHIGDYAFSGCHGLIRITIPSSVTSIGNGAFYYCHYLNIITLPKSITHIGDSAFGSCEYLYQLVIPEGVTAIGADTFAECPSLTSITIPETVTSIGSRAFMKCYDLTGVIIPESVTSIGDKAFSECYSITSIEIPSSVTSIGAEAFYFCQKLASVTLNEGLVSIGDRAFASCVGQPTIAIPNSVAHLGTNPFAYVQNVTVSEDHPTFSLTDGALFDTTTNRLIAYLPSDASAYEIPQGTEIIGAYAFAGGNFSSLTIPSSVTSIGARAFQNCSDLTSLVILDSVTSIGDDAFYGCDGITLSVESGSYAEQYAGENEISYTYH